MNTLQKAIIGVRNVGLGNTLNTVRSALFKSLIERRFSSEPKLEAPRHPGSLREARPVENGARFEFENAALEIVFLAGDLARAAWEPGREPLPYGLEKTGWDPVDVTLEEHPEGYVLCGPQLQVRVAQDGGLDWRDAQDRLLRSEAPPERQGERWIHRASLVPEERIYGLGEQTAPLNRRGQAYRMWNTDPGGTYGPGDGPIYQPLPVYLGLHAAGSYLVFFENPHPATFSFPGTGEAGPAEARFDGGQLRYYLVAGPPDAALRRFTELTGRPPLPPQWALGYHMSRWGYENESDVMAVADGFRKHELPLSAIHLDLHYMDGFRVFTIDRRSFPDLRGLAQKLAERAIRLVTIIDPGVKQDRDYDVFREGYRAEVYVTEPTGHPYVGLVWPGWTVFPDFTDPKAREWWGGYYDRLLDEGVEGFWHDMNEPTSFTAWGDMSLPKPVRHSLEGRGGDHREAHNVYGLLMNRAGFKAVRKKRPEYRPWFLSRSGWVGNQRYAWNWTADTESTWEALRMTVATVLGNGLSGLAFTGSDIGGFSGDPSPELYLRWLQAAALMPFFRTHSAIRMLPREPWVYGEPVLGTARHFLQLRYSLMPYLYSLAWQASETGLPLARPLFWSDPQEQSLWDVDDAFTLGDDLLVAPVLEPGADSREVTLPAGEWFGLWDDQLHRGPGRIRVETGLEAIPLLVRSGGLLPMEEDGELILHLYAAGSQAAGEFRLFSDAGDGYGPWRTDRFQLAGEGDTLVLTRESEGDYPWPYSRLILALHGFPVARAVVDGQPAQIEDGRIDAGPFREIRLERA